MRSNWKDSGLLAYEGYGGLDQFRLRMWSYRLKDNLTKTVLKRKAREIS